MGPVQAIKTGFAKSFRFSGRATRSEFWLFAPIGILVALIFGWLVVPKISSVIWPQKRLATFFAMIPISAAGARRLQDTDQDGQAIFRPVLLLLVAPLCMMLLLAPIAVIPILGPALAWMVLFPVVAICTFISLLSLSSITGHLIVPSCPGTNHYGPNPKEVQQ